MTTRHLPATVKVLPPIVAGRTEWRSAEYRSVPCWRGSQTKQIAVRDEKGKPAFKAERYVTILIQCSDGVAYSFDYHATLAYDTTPEVLIHGIWHEADSLPVEVERAHRRTLRRLRVIAGRMRDAYAALRAFRPRVAQ